MQPLVKLIPVCDLPQEEISRLIRDKRALKAFLGYPQNKSLNAGHGRYSPSRLAEFPTGCYLAPAILIKDRIAIPVRVVFVYRNFEGVVCSFVASATAAFVNRYLAAREK